MTRNALGVVLVAALVVLAGCSGAPGSGTAATDGTPLDDGNGPGATAGSTGTIDFYISDEPNAINDFEHLNVTITKVGLHQVESGAESTATATPTNDTATPSNETATETPTNGTATATAAEGTESEDAETESEEAESDGDGESDGEGDARWVEYEVNKTVDLTELVGANATKLDVLEAPAGSYDKVFVYVSDIDATLKNGESVNVKLPSEKLQINKQFQVGDGSNVSFVFDIAVHKAGKSGKYILKPVVSQSGTGDEVDIENVEKKGEKGKDEGDDEKSEEDGENADDGEDAEAAELDVEFVGQVAAGENATVKVTGADGPVANATVEVDGEVVGTTGADGTVTFAVGEDTKKLKVKVEKGDAEAELERNLNKQGGNPSLSLSA